eukprot:5405325-Prymnesium_polylepis.1
MCIRDSNHTQYAPVFNRGPKAFADKKRTSSRTRGPRSSRSNGRAFSYTRALHFGRALSYPSCADVLHADKGPRRSIADK